MIPFAHDIPGVDGYTTPPPQAQSLLAIAILILPRRKFVHEVMNFHGLFMNVHENA